MVNINFCRAENFLISATFFGNKCNHHQLNVSNWEKLLKKNGNQVLSWNSDDSNCASVVPRSWFNRRKVHQYLVRKSFSHLTSCNYQLCTQGNQTASLLCWKKMCRGCAPHDVLLKNQQRRHPRLHMASPFLLMNTIRYSKLKHLKHVTENKGSDSLGTLNYLSLQGTIRCRCSFYQHLPRKDAWETSQVC